jgi:predicted dehydrogenase
MSKLIKTGIVGVGSIGKNHARIYSELMNTEFVSVYDTEASSAEAISTTYQVPAASSI